MGVAQKSSKRLLVMKIGIDISQIVYEGTGVARHVRYIVKTLLSIDQSNEYVLFGSSLRKKSILNSFVKEMQQLHPRVIGKIISLPPTMLDCLWNILHIIPITRIIGHVDIFWSSDWTQPPLGTAKGVTTIHDLSFLKYPKQTDKRIIAVHNRRLKHALKECSMFFCVSESTKKDVMELYTMTSQKLSVVYPGGIW